ncbi:hypothetical protein AVEN_167042-1 [Araneus ventricosus]|uniref:RING-type domain-containing protein n=1 Tax=Araneus ventricosus TaxID=182803 RepID=A0A4Y2SKN7_ARAVE|nr:hypothetical protein AVEN_167042-1 [Araneus ventricosus]
MCFPFTRCYSEITPIIQVPEFVCGICAYIIQPDEEIFELDCGCIHHLYCLMDELEILEECPLCEDELVMSDVLELRDLRQFQMEKELSS